MIKLAITVLDTSSQNLPGTVSYSLDGASSIREHIDFTINLACCDFLVSGMSQKDAFSLELNRERLIFKNHREVRFSRGLAQALDIICNQCRLSLVEKVEGAATLFGRSVMGHLVCLLIKEKFNDQHSCLKIESTGDNNSLLSGIMVDIEAALNNAAGTDNKFGASEYRIVSGIR